MRMVIIDLSYTDTETTMKHRSFIVVSISLKLFERSHTGLHLKLNFYTPSNTRQQ